MFIWSGRVIRVSYPNCTGFLFCFAFVVVVVVATEAGALAAAEIFAALAFTIAVSFFLRFIFTSWLLTERESQDRNFFLYINHTQVTTRSLVWSHTNITPPPIIINIIISQENPSINKTTISIIYHYHRQNITKQSHKLDS